MPGQVQTTYVPKRHYSPAQQEKRRQKSENRIYKIVLSNEQKVAFSQERRKETEQLYQKDKHIFDKLITH